MTKKNRNLLSLFSGCGGLDLGFEGGFKALRRSINEARNSDWIEERIDENWVNLKKTQFKTVFANDILREAEAAWVPFFQKHDINSNTFRRGSIIDFVKQAKNGEDIFPEEIDVVTGGFPCQDFSVAGKRNGFESNKDHHGKNFKDTNPTIENRGQLYIWMKDVIEIVQPKVFIAENVKGLVSLANVKEIIQKDFSSIGDNGYIVVDARVLNAAEYGVPQNRERVIFIGISKEALKPGIQQKIVDGDIDLYPKATHYLNDRNKQSDKVPFVKTKETLIELEEPEDSSDDAQKVYSKAKFMGKHCQGQTEVKLNGLSPTIRAEHHGNIEFRRLGIKNGGKYTEELNSGLRERRLTVRECARIQTFPDDYMFIRNPRKRTDSYRLSGSSAYKLIGNAVPPILGYNIAMRLDEIWNELFK